MHFTGLILKLSIESYDSICEDWSSWIFYTGIRKIFSFWLFFFHFPIVLKIIDLIFTFLMPCVIFSISFPLIIVLGKSGLVFFQNKQILLFI